MDDLTYMHQIRAKWLFLGWMSMVFIWLACFLYMKFLLSPEYYTEKVQKELRNYQTEFNKLKIKLEAFPPEKLWTETGNQKLPEHFVYVISSKDDILFWSGGFEIPENPDSHYLRKNEIINQKNGWYWISEDSILNHKITAFGLVYEEFAYENSYLTNGFPSKWNIPGSIKISQIKNSEEAFSWPVGNTGLGLIIPSPTPIPDFLLNLLSFLYALALIFALAWVTKIYFKWSELFSHVFFRISFHLVDLTILALLMRSLFLMIVFDMGWFQKSQIPFSSIDNQLIDLITTLILLAFWAHYLYIQNTSKLTKIQALWAPVLIVLYASSLYFAIRILVYLFEQTNQTLLLTDFLSANLFSILWLAFLGLLLFSVFSWNHLILKMLILHITAKKPLNKLLLFSILSAFLLGYFIYAGISIWGLVLLGALLHVNMMFILQSKYIRQNIHKAALRLLYFAFMASLIFIFVKQTQLDHLQNRYAEAFADEDDPVLRAELETISNEIMHDTLLNQMLRDTNDKLLFDYLHSNYYEKLVSNYEVQTTICSPQDELMIEPENIVVNCFDYFGDQMQFNLTNETKSGVFTTQHNFAGKYFLLYLSAPDWPFETRLFVEFSAPYIPEGYGFPELLIRPLSGLPEFPVDFSLAKYNRGVQLYQHGSFNYTEEFSIALSAGTEMNRRFLTKNYKHKVSENEKGAVYIISRPTIGVIQWLMPWAYFFLLFLIFDLLFFQLSSGMKFWRFNNLSFRDRLQWSAFGILLIGLVSVGILSVAQIKQIYKDENQSFIQEKSKSVVIELYYKLSEQTTFDESLSEYLNSILYKFSKVFFVDINFYSLPGELLGSSRTQIIDEGLVSKWINPEAYRAIVFEGKTFYLQSEQVDEGKFQSAYLPFYSSRGELEGIVNLPFFAREREFRSNLAAFVSSYVNLLLLLVFVGIILTMFLARYLLQPLNLLQNKIGELSFGNKNEKIDWQADDEIGQLVAAYNQAVEELEISAEKLALSERESAWKRMARQVAHEIKNPLTPIKLSAQHLQQSYDPDKPEWQARFQQFSKILIDQIESLTKIADAFSDFAKLPDTTTQAVDFKFMINQLLNLYSSHAPVTFESNAEECWVLADEKQLERAVQNLIINALQAVSDTKQPLVQLQLNCLDQEVEFLVRDNGKGIDPSNVDFIFQPNFTTKSSGMGLGLAISKNIIENMQGKIWFESELNKGSVFGINLKRVQRP